MSSATPGRKLYTLTEAGQELVRNYDDVAPLDSRTVRSMIERGELSAIKIGKRTFVREMDIIDHEKTREINGA